ncbi:MAG: hypothetical protein H5U07_00990 [Candidatus Aminicenantes bacterium]|nr:hypothetical protein [Candidatus Aminicenantes bacterium]
MGIRCEEEIRKSIDIIAVLKSEQSKGVHVQSLSPKVSLEGLKPGEYSSVEGFVRVPDNWLEGIARLYLGVKDKRRATYLKPEGQGFEEDENGLIYIGTINIFSIEN